jgi:hypothetical protein
MVLCLAAQFVLRLWIAVDRLDSQDPARNIDPQNQDDDDEDGNRCSDEERLPASRAEKEWDNDQQQPSSTRQVADWHFSPYFQTTPFNLPRRLV